jgi:hypothetical protein
MAVRSEFTAKVAWGSGAGPKKIRASQAVQCPLAPLGLMGL